jgi:hypothetical protein
MDEGHVVVDSIAPIKIADITDDLARESGFSGVKDLLETAKHGRGSKVYLIRFHYLRPGAWDVPRGSVASEERDEGLSPSSRQTASDRRSTLLQRIRSSSPGPGGKAKGEPATRQNRRRKA